MCGIYVAYANVPMMCQACDVSPEDSDTSIKGGRGVWRLVMWEPGKNSYTSYTILGRKNFLKFPYRNYLYQGCAYAAKPFWAIFQVFILHMNDQKGMQ